MSLPTALKKFFWFFYWSALYQKSCEEENKKPRADQNDRKQPKEEKKKKSGIQCSPNAFLREKTKQSTGTDSGCRGDDIDNLHI